VSRSSLGGDMDLTAATNSSIRTVDGEARDTVVAFELGSLVCFLLLASPAAAQVPQNGVFPFLTGEGLSAATTTVLTLFLLAVLLESALAIIFNWRPFIESFNARATRPLVSFGVALAFVVYFNFDAVTGLMNAVQKTAWPANWFGHVLTAAILAGGSAGVNTMLVALGFRELKTQDTGGAKARSDSSLGCYSSRSGKECRGGTSANRGVEHEGSPLYGPAPRWRSSWFNEKTRRPLPPLFSSRHGSIPSLRGLSCSVKEALQDRAQRREEGRPEQFVHFLGTHRFRARRTRHNRSHDSALIHPFVGTTEAVSAQVGVCAIAERPRSPVQSNAPQVHSSGSSALRGRRVSEVEACSMSKVIIFPEPDRKAVEFT
jgi:hypothetical protein